MVEQASAKPSFTCCGLIGSVCWTCLLCLCAPYCFGSGAVLLLLGVGRFNVWLWGVPGPGFMLHSCLHVLLCLSSTVCAEEVFQSPLCKLCGLSKIETANIVGQLWP